MYWLMMPPEKFDILDFNKYRLFPNVGGEDVNENMSSLPGEANSTRVVI